MGLFDYRKEEEARERKYRALVEGCKKHPGYRYKRKPQVKCAKCEELFDFAEQLRQWDAQCDQWWRVYHAVEYKKQQEWSEREEARLNYPG